MATSSYPQQGLFPGDGPDCGPYTANEWRAWLLTGQRAGGMVNTGAVAPPGLPATPLYPNIGVYYVCPNRLVVTSPGASQIAIDTGAALCDGTFFYNDTAITPIAITAPAANPRIDMVVVRQNYSGGDYTSVNAPGLVVTDNTADFAVISGAEAGAPVPPTVTQNQDRATFWDIPLYQYQISVAGAITALTDLREWVDAETKRFMVRFPVGFNHSTGPAAYFAETAMGPMLTTAEWKDAYTAGGWAVPNNFISGLTATPILVVGNGVNPGNARLYFSYTHGTCGELRTIHNATTGAVDRAILGTDTGKRLCLTDMTLSLTNAAVLDIADFTFDREGSHINDTYDDLLYAHGVLLEWLGWGRK